MEFVLLAISNGGAYPVTTKAYPKTFNAFWCTVDIFFYGLFVCMTDDSSVGACSLLALVWAIMISQNLKYLHRSCANHES